MIDMGIENVCIINGIAQGCLTALDNKGLVDICRYSFQHGKDCPYYRQGYTSTCGYGFLKNYYNNLVGIVNTNEDLGKVEIFNQNNLDGLGF
jgi:hypothetical protein